MTAPAAKERRYAVAFRTHIWDDYVARQYRRLVERARGGDVFVLLDETNGKIPVSEGRVVSHTRESVKALGLADAGHGNLLWYNGDYPLYFFFRQHPDYEHYVLVEYDVAVHGNVDDMVSHAAREGIGLTALTRGEDVAEWPYTSTCLDAYALEDVKKRMICFSIFSREAVKTLYERRLALSDAYRLGKLRRWPYCEAYIPTELALGGFKLAELSDFGRVDHFDWRPAIVETDLAAYRRQVFVHPVLDQRRYVQATLKIGWSTTDVLNPRSEIWRLLRRVPARLYGFPLAVALRERIAASLRLRLGRAASLAKRGRRDNASPAA